LAVWTIGPLLIALSTSLKMPAAVFGQPGLIPQDPTWAAYSRLLTRPGFRTALLNSVILGFGTISLTLVLGVPAAYAFARLRFFSRHLLLVFILLPRLVPSLGLMVPLYRMAAALGVLDSRLTLIVCYTGILLPVAIWLLVGFFQQIPITLEEAAAVDGANLWKRLRYVVLPLSVPALTTIAVLGFREAWQEFELVLVLTTQPSSRTLPYELFRLLGDAHGGVPDFPMEAAFALFTMAPLILVYMWVERYVVGGITAGSVKS